MTKTSILFIACFFFALLLPINAATAEVADGYYAVNFVVNGDSFKLTDGRTVRLIGIEAPQTGENCSVQAKDRLSYLIEGKTIYLEKDVSETDGDDRLLRYAYIDDTFINYKLAYDGYAYADISYPDIKYAAELTAAEESARRHDRGCLWYSSCLDCDDDYNAFVSCFITTASDDSPSGRQSLKKFKKKPPSTKMSWLIMFMALALVCSHTGRKSS